MVTIVDTTDWRVPKHPALIAWRATIIPLRILFLLSICSYLVASFKSEQLPPPSHLLPILNSPPLQSETTTPRFSFEWRGSTFIIEPQAEYQAQGLLLTHNNVGGIGDIYHDSDAVDLKDICITWGSSAISGSYTSGTFSSEPWTCVYTPHRGAKLIAMNEFSNNHLLAGTQKIADTIRNARIGDQVRFKGYLVDYAPSTSPDLVRRTSLIREDTGDGACEVVFVTSFEILKSANLGWRKIESISTYLMLSLGIFLVLSGIVLPYLEYRFE